MVGAAALIAATPVLAAEADGQYDIYLLLHRVGAETFTRSGDAAQAGRLSIASRLSDRGAVRAATTEVQFGSGLEVTRLESRREGAPTPTAAFAAQDGKVQVQEGGVTRTFAPPAVAFPGATAMPAALQALMFDYWRTHGRPARLKMLRAQAAAPAVQIVPRRPRPRPHGRRGRWS